MSEMNASREMPRYQCYKQVWALKIADIDIGPNGDGSIAPADEGYGRFLVDAAYMSKHNPAVGGYYVVYGDGYKSFSPAESFESGYTKIDR